MSVELNNKVCASLTFEQDTFPWFILNVFDFADPDNTMWATEVESDGETEWESYLSTMLHEDYMYDIMLADKGMDQGREMCYALWKNNAMESLTDSACCQMYTFMYDDEEDRFTYAELSQATTTEDFDSDLTTEEEDEETGETLQIPIKFGAEILNFADYETNGSWGDAEEEEASAAGILSAWVAIAASASAVVVLQ